MVFRIYLNQNNFSPEGRTAEEAWGVFCGSNDKLLQFKIVEESKTGRYFIAPGGEAETRFAQTLVCAANIKMVTAVFFLDANFRNEGRYISEGGASATLRTEVFSGTYVRQEMKVSGPTLDAVIDIHDLIRMDALAPYQDWGGKLPVFRQEDAERW